MVRLCLGFAFLLLIAGAGCSRQTERPVSLRSDSLGIEIVQYSGPDQPLTWSVQELFRLGGSETRPEESFYEIYPDYIAVDTAGQLYALNRSTSMISVFDDTGNHLRSVGRIGNGPGEIGYAAGLVLLKNGNIGAVDMSRFAIVSFGPDGEPLPLLPVPTRWRGGGIILSGDTMITAVQLPTASQSAMAYGLIRATPSDTTPVAVMTEVEGRSIHLTSCGMRIERATPIFTPTLRWSGGKERIAVATDVVYDIMVLDGTGKVMRVRREVEPVAATADLALADLGEGMRIGERICDPREMVEKYEFASHMSAIGRLAVAPGGAIWVRRGQVGSGPAPTDIFSASGDYVGTLPDAFPFPVAFFPDGRIVGAETDDFGISRAVVYEIVPGP